MSTILIAAVDKGGVIGQHGKIPWHYPEDLAYFKELTTRPGTWLIVGRNTYESLPEVVKKRDMVVLTRGGLCIDEKWTATSVVDAIDAARKAGAKHIAICGGYEVYKEALSDHRCTLDAVHITRIPGHTPTSKSLAKHTVYFPRYSLPYGWVVKGKRLSSTVSVDIYSRR